MEPAAFFCLLDAFDYFTSCPATGQKRTNPYESETGLADLQSSCVPRITAMKALTKATNGAGSMTQTRRVKKLLLGR